MAQKILFIADVHLTPERPLMLEKFLTFLADKARHWERLYILGDLFEVWLGDDENEPSYQLVIENLHYLTTQETQVFIMPGNRDFLLGQKFSEMTGCQLLPDPTPIDLYGIPTLLMHGDTLCTQDLIYQNFRQQVRNPQWQQQFLAQPLAQRRLIAQQVRLQSEQHTQHAMEEIMDVTHSEVVKILQQYQIFHLIHGHTHRPAIHHFSVDGQPAWRKVVGAWYQQNALGLSCTQTGCQLKQLL